MPFKTLFRRLQAKRQALFLQLGKILLDRTPPPFGRAPSPEHLRSVLFLRQDGKIGDFIVSAFALREIKKNHPHIRIGVLCSDKNRHLFADAAHIDELHQVKAKSLTDYYRTARKLAGRYDAVIEPTRVFRLRDLVLLRFLAAPFNIGLDKADYRLFNLNISDTRQHYSDIYRRALELLGFDNPDTRPMLPENPQSKRDISAFLAENDLDGYTALNFFGAAKSRRFSQEAIGRVLAELTQTFARHRFVLLTAPDTAAQLQDWCAVYPQCFVYGQTRSIADSIELIRHALAVVSPDTAIVHIAAALDKPTIGLYQDNPQNLANWYPKTEQATLLFFRQHIDEIQAPDIAEALRPHIPDT